MQHGFQLSFDITPPEPPKPAPLPPPPYTVRLHDSDLDGPQRIHAEVRFCRALEETLGGPEAVRDLLRVLQDAEFLGRQLTSEEQPLGRKWQRAHLAARLTALQDLAAITPAWFEVTV